jgi:hypothetical protein
MCPKFDIAHLQFWVKMLLNPTVVAAALARSQSGSRLFIKTVYGQNLITIFSTFSLIHFFAI